MDNNIKVEIEIEVPCGETIDKVSPNEDNTLKDNQFNFILSTEDIIRKDGFEWKILTSGMDITEFMDNAPALYNHDTEKVIGQWINTVKTEDNKIMSTINFDMDEDSCEIMDKVKGGSLKRCSVGLDIIDWNFDDNGVIIVEKSVLLECSIVPIPANRNAKKLNSKPQMTLSANGKPINKDKLNEIINSKKEKQMELKLQADFDSLQLNFDSLKLSNETLLNEKLNFDNSLLELKMKNDELTLKLDGLNNEMNLIKEKELNDFLNLSIEEGKITLDGRNDFLELGRKDLELCKSMINKLVPKVNKIHTQSNTNTNTNANILKDKTTWSYSDWINKDPKGLKHLELNDSSYYNQLYNKYKEENQKFFKNYKN